MSSIALNGELVAESVYTTPSIRPALDAIELLDSQKVIASRAKRVLDLVGSIILLIALSPLFAVIGLAIIADSGLPVFYRQRRVTVDRRRGSRRRAGERTFTCWKFRTMVRDADRMRDELVPLNAAPFPTFKVRRDPRVTRLGRFLRRSSLDELPQLWNVVRGEMSLVGPRPALPSEVASYDHFALERLSVRPGLTCLWQIGPRHHDESTFRDWVEQDIDYIRKWSLRMDLAVLWKTAFAVLRMTGE